jgi:cation diffusion facilitator family transporter
MRSEAQRLGYLEGWISVFLNTALFVVKYAVGVAAGSIAMVADAWHTLSDTLTSVVLLLGFWISARRPDKEHPFGHGRAEVISALIIGTLLAVVGVGFLKESIYRLQHHTSATFSTMAVIVFVASVILKEGLAQFSIWAGKKTHSNSLMADGWHHRSDAIASALIVVGALLGSRVWWIDGVMGICVSLLILYATFDIMKHAASPLLGEAPDEQMELKIQELVRRLAPKVQALHHFHMHRYGAHVELTFHVRLPPDIQLSEAHETATRIETALRDQLNIEATIHTEPYI